MKTRYIALFAVLALALAACGGGEEASDTTAADPTDEAAAETVEEAPGPTEAPAAEEAELTQVDAEPTEDAAPAADDPRAADAAVLAGRIDGESFPYELEDEQANGPLFLYLAATESDPTLVRAALQALDESYCPGEFDGCNPIDEEFLTVVTGHLTADTDPNIVTAAVELGGKALNLDEEPTELLDAMLALAADIDDPALDAAVANEIWQADWEGNPAVEALYLEAVSSDVDYLNKVGTFRIETGSPSSLAAFDDFYAALTANLGHENFAVYGGSLKALGEMMATVDRSDPRWQEVYDAADVARTHAHPFVRGAAMNAWESMKALEAIPTVISDHLADFEDGGLGSVSFTAYDGRSDSIGFDISAWSNVTDAAMTMLWWSTSGQDWHFDYLGDYDIELGEGAPEVDDQIAAIAEEARAWFTTNEAAIAAAAGGA